MLAARKYKPVDCKVCLVPTYVPDPAGQGFKPIDIPELPPLPLDPPLLEDFEVTMQLTQEHLNFIFATVPEGFLSPHEINLLVSVLRS